MHSRLGFGDALQTILDLLMDAPQAFQMTTSCIILPEFNDGTCCIDRFQRFHEVIVAKQLQLSAGFDRHRVIILRRAVRKHRPLNHKVSKLGKHVGTGRKRAGHAAVHYLQIHATPYAASGFELPGNHRV